MTRKPAAVKPPKAVVARYSNCENKKSLRGPAATVTVDDAMLPARA